MQLDLKKTDTILVVQITGELDHHCADEIRRRIDRELMSVQINHVIFDFSELSFMDSSGIGMLMGRYRVIKYLGGQAWIVCHSAAIEKILEMAGIFQYFKRYEDCAALVEELRASSQKDRKSGVIK